jgi:transketolase
MISYDEMANAIRALSMDAVEKAQSGHPGMPMGMADIATVLWKDFLKHNPNDPNWLNRDRFVLSNGHGSMLQYALLHLTGYDLTIDDIKTFRQLHSKTPGHPEHGITPGVETTTGPLGQGLANAVGMALAEKNLASIYNRPGFNLIDHHTYVFLGDGCLMEGISHEASSLAGALNLGKLIAFWDDNSISIDGPVRDWFRDDTPRRFEAYHWHVIRDVDGHNPTAIHRAILEAQAEKDKPTLICCKTTIGFGAPRLANTAKAHGAPLGSEEIALAREKLRWPYTPFVIPEGIYQAWDARNKGNHIEKEWQDLWSLYEKEFTAEAKELTQRYHRTPSVNWPEQSDAYIRTCQESANKVATRKASLNALNAYGPFWPSLIGGSADLTESNLTWWQGSTILTAEKPAGNYIHFGVREFAMSAIANGIALHGGFIPYVGTFLTFLDYARNAVRLSAMMRQQVIYVYTHDSLGLGEDGPTHQPVEHATMLRITPHMSTWRPADEVETAVAWKIALQRKDGPTSLLLSRQALPTLERKPETLANIERGAYVVFESSAFPSVILIATGSEVILAVNAAKTLQQQGVSVRVVSMPSADHFEAQNAEYKESVLPRKVLRRLAIEAGASAFWYRYVGLKGRVLGLDEFGVSAPAADAFKYFGFTTDNIIAQINLLLSEEL